MVLGKKPRKFVSGQEASRPRARKPRGPKVVIQPLATSSELPNQLVYSSAYCFLHWFSGMGLAEFFSHRRSHPPYWSFAWRLSRADALRAQVWRQSVPPVIPPGWRAVAVPAVFRPQRHLPGRRSFRQAVHGWLRIFSSKAPGASSFRSPEEVAGGVFSGCSASPDGGEARGVFLFGEASPLTAGGAAFFSLLEWGNVRLLSRDGFFRGVPGEIIGSACSSQQEQGENPYAGGVLLFFRSWGREPA